MKKRHLLILQFFLAVSAVNGQSGTVSPYSRYGLGDLQFGGFSSELSMGGIQAGLRDPFHINYSNPASYSSIRFTTFEMGVKGQWVDFATQNLKGKANSISFSYLAIAFPILKGKWGGSFGLIPYSDIGYNIKQTDYSLTQIGPVNYLFEGSGGINRFYLGSGVTIFKNLNIGLNASYLFGNLQRTRKVEFPDQTFYFNTLNKVNTDIHDFYFNYGIQYVLKLKKEQSLTIGISGAFSTKVKSTNDLVTVNYVLSNFGSPIYKDTIESLSNSKGNTTLPFSLTGGLTYKKSEKWLLGADYSFQNWSKFQSFGNNDSLNDSYRIALGAQFTPDNSSLKILNRIHYRAGLRYSQTYIKLKNTPLNEYGVSLGFGMPLKIKSPPRVLPTINFSIEGGQRGTTDNNLLRERYIRFHLGITISEEWFIPRKFD